VIVTMTVIPRAAVAQVDVWIDPGHGGPKPGNLGYSQIPARYEKALALAQSERLESRLIQIGYRALKTRNGDNNPSFQRRADMASGLATNDLDQQEPGQMLSIIHMNAGAPSALGTETCFANYERYSRRLDAYKVDSTFAAIVHCDLMTGANAAFLRCNDERGVKCAPHWVSRRARVPAVYIEVCLAPTNVRRQTSLKVETRF
jgi:N-acetylmuramoyl-L-alanine amidase